MSLSGSPQIAPAALLGFDTDSIVSPELALQFFQQGYQFCIRYVSRSPEQGPSDLSASEAAGILAAGLALGLVQHVRAEGWVPAAALGASDGAQAALHASNLGFPPGINVWCDLEGVRDDISSADVVGYCNAWHDALAAAGYTPGIYVGSEAILDGQELYRRLKFQHYWKSLSRVPDVATRGYQMIQRNEHILNGIGIDENVTQDDHQGGAVIFLTPDDPSES